MSVEIFLDRASWYRYRIKGLNGETLVTSEGYTTRSDASRGYRDLVDEITRMERQGGSNGHFSGEDAEQESEADVQEAPEDQEGTQATGKGFSRHDECPDDNPDALKPEDDNA